jgi:hypothetical protein
MDPQREPSDLGQALGEILAPKDVDGGEGELHPAREKLAVYGVAGELALRVIPDRWHDPPTRRGRP